ncbi:hypothetical protein SAMN05192575_108161 [Nocardioides alpinus]|uniref:Uncharacterized protein n=1 Tax=Nocardioides alpinus TaxID=748909 RepID=A0A1I1ACY5_9ACTN|nr:hypothetical protein [Nocardioides alpinus]PKH43520.1 hypothetical protein CXG46_03445 [Nocardioides alpinus]SFB35854.1 hypothetical protein SAMN05192575_108161 [Nocardioides alpinus]
MKAVIGGALAVLVLALVTLSVVQRVKEARDEPVVTPISADAYYALGGALTCDSELHEVPHLPLEAEPVAMLVCADPAPVGSVPWTSPDDLVEGDLAPLVEVLGDLEPTPDEPYDCTFQGGPAYDLLLRFSRDRYARIHGDTGGCGVVTVASGEWFGANEVLDAALALVEEQRAARPVPTAIPDPPGCPVDGDLGPAYSLTGEVTDLVVAVSCWRPDAKQRPPSGDPVPVPPRELGLLLTDVERNSKPLETPGDYDCPGGPRELYSQVLLGRTAWGDLVALSGMCREFYVDVWSQRPGDEAPRVWHPSPTAQRILDDLRR